MDVERGVLNLWDSKTGPKTVPLSEPALEILRGLPRLAGNPHVIPGWKTGEPYRGEAKAWERIREAAGLADVRIHDLRHAFASVAISNSGASLALVGGAIGHTSAASTSRYAHLAQDPIRAVSELTAGLITCLFWRRVALVRSRARGGEGEPPRPSGRRTEDGSDGARGPSRSMP